MDRAERPGREERDEKGHRGPEDYHLGFTHPQVFLGAMLSTPVAPSSLGSALCLSSRPAFSSCCFIDCCVYFYLLTVLGSGLHAPSPAVPSRAYSSAKCVRASLLQTVSPRLRASEAVCGFCGRGSWVLEPSPCVVVVYLHHWVARKAKTSFVEGAQAWGGGR